MLGIAVTALVTFLGLFLVGHAIGSTFEDPRHEEDYEYDLKLYDEEELLEDDCGG